MSNIVIEYLPKDLCNIVYDYNYPNYKYQYNDVLKQLERYSIYAVRCVCAEYNFENNFEQFECECDCNYAHNYIELKKFNCYENFMISLNKIIENKQMYNHYLVEQGIFGITEYY